MDSEHIELVKRFRRLVVDVQAKVTEMDQIVTMLADEIPTRQVKEQDEYGEPTWAYMVKVAIPKDIKLTRRLREYAVEAGFQESAVSELWNGGPTSEGFVRYYRRTGRRWLNWSLVWMKWVRDEKVRKHGVPARGGESRFDRLSRVGK